MSENPGDRYECEQLEARERELALLESLSRSARAIVHILGRIADALDERFDR